MDVDALRAEVGAEVDAAARAALAMAMPDPATAADGVFAHEAVPLGDGLAPWSGWDSAPTDDPGRDDASEAVRR